MVEPERSGGVGSRLDRFFGRSPYIVAAIAIAAMALMFDTSRRLYHTHGPRAWLDWVVLGFVLYSCAALFLLPRLVARGRKPPSYAALARLRSTVALVPFLIGYGAWSSGGDEWSAVVACLASAALLLVAARITTSLHPIRT
jgi:hypothetical protein